MSDKQNGNLYHLVLGLPEDAAPPNHYELLGLDHRTSDPAVINNAAADQNRKLLHWQNSDRYAEVRALTLEVVQARSVLLNEASRTLYDATLGEWGVLEDGPWVVEEPRPRENSALPLSVQCPDCEASFKLRNRDLIGRRMPCPECGFRFTVRPEAETIVEVVQLDAVALMEDPDWDAELAELDNFDDMENLPRSRSGGSTTTQRRRRQADDGHIVQVEPDQDEDGYDDYEAAARSRSRSRPASRMPSRSLPAHRSGPRSSAHWAVVAGGLLMSAAIVLLVVLFVQRLQSPASAQHPLAYLPADCQTVGYYRMGEVSRSPFFQDHLTRSLPLRGQVDQFRERTGMDLQDLDAVVIGLKEHDPGRFHSLGLMTNLRGLRFVAVARASKDWDRARLIGDHSESATHDNQTYHVFSPEPNSSERWALYLADARTLIFGSVAEVEAAIETAGRVPDWQDIDFLQPEYPIVTASVAGPGTAGYRGPPPSGVIIPAGMSFANQGSGLVLEGDEVQQVAFLKFESAGDAAQFVSLSNESERRRASVQPLGFRQHGRTVAVSRGGLGRMMDAVHGNTASAPLSLLARLGSGSVKPLNSINPQPTPANPFAQQLGLPKTNPPADQLAPAPDVNTLNTLMAGLQDNRRAKDSARQLARMQPDPMRSREVARLLETVIVSGAHFDKQAAADALGVWGSSDNVPFLIGLLEQKTRQDVFLNRHVLVALGRLKDPRGLPAMIDSLKNIPYRGEASKALKLYGAGAEPELLKALAGNDWQQQQAICNVLKDVGTARSLPDLDAIAATGHDFVKPLAQAAAVGIRAGQP